MTNVLCGQQLCKRYELTLKEFEKLGGETWDQGFRSSLGKRARALYIAMYKREPNKVRSSRVDEWRNTVGKYPCGILEQAYRDVKRKREEAEVTQLKSPVPRAANQN